MRRIAMIAACFAASASTLFAQATALPGGTSGGNSPQFALALLTEHFEDDAKDRKVGGAWLTGIGSSMFALGAAGIGLSFTSPPTALYSTNEEWMIMRGVSIGTAALGGVLGGIGVGLLAKPADAYKREYAMLYAETDPVVQEAIAYGIMKDLADDARRSRVVGGLVNVMTPVATAGAWAISSAASGNWDDFDDHVMGSLTWTLPSLVTGILMLATGKSDEERMLDAYRSMSASYSGRGRSRSVRD